MISTTLGKLTFYATTLVIFAAGFWGVFFTLFSGLTPVLPQLDPFHSVMYGLLSLYLANAFPSNNPDRLFLASFTIACAGIFLFIRWVIPTVSDAHSIEGQMALSLMLGIVLIIQGAVNSWYYIKHIQSVQAKRHTIDQALL